MARQTTDRNFIVAIIQARTGSTRFPRKSLALLCGKPLLLHVISRVKKSKLISKVVVATTILKEDQEIINMCQAEKIDSFQGSVDDVLDRYYKTAKKVKADIIVRITADCALIDPSIIDRSINQFLSTPGIDYVGYNVQYPEGSDVETFSFHSLERAWKNAKLPSEREHVTPFIVNHPEMFKIAMIKSRFKKDYSKIHLSIDYERDLVRTELIIKALGNRSLYMKNVLDFLSKHPEIAKIGQDVDRFEGYKKSLAMDKHGTDNR